MAPFLTCIVHAVAKPYEFLIGSNDYHPMEDSFFVSDFILPQNSGYIMSCLHHQLDKDRVTIQDFVMHFRNAFKMVATVLSFLD